jgi:ribosomal protein L29
MKITRIEEIRAMSPQQVKELNDELSRDLAKLFMARIGIAVATHLAVKGFVWYLTKKR